MLLGHSSDLMRGAYERPAYQRWWLNPFQLSLPWGCAIVKRRSLPGVATR